MVPEHLEEMRSQKLELIATTEAAVKDRLTKEINYWDHRAETLKLQEVAGRANARLNSNEARKRADNLQVDHRPARVDSILTPDVWLEPEVVVEVLADEITPSPRHTAGMAGEEPGFALRFPRVVSFRGADKRPEDATTVKEIEQLFLQQRERKTPA